MKLPELLLPATLVGSLLLACAPASRGAVTVINNFGAGTQGFAASLSGPTAEIFFSPFDNREVAFSFVTGAVPVELLSLRFTVSIGDVQIDPIHMELSTGSPLSGPVSGVSMGSVAPASSTPVTQTLAVSPPMTVTLAPATTYWVHVTVPAGGAVYSFLNNNVPVTEPGWSLGNTWYFSPDDGWLEISSGPKARIELNVQPVPEPASSLLAAAGVVLLLGRRRGVRCQ